MEFKPELIGYCGFYCGSCPTYIKGDCSGCLAAHRKGDCFTNTCVQERNLRFCGECSEFPCDDIIAREKATVLDPCWLKWKKAQKKMALEQAHQNPDLI